MFIESHVEDQEVEAAPAISEVLAQSQGAPLEEHLAEEEEGEQLIGSMKNLLQQRPLMKVHVLERLSRDQGHNASHDQGHDASHDQGHVT